MAMTSIDGELLDKVEDELRGRTKADAMQSGDIADAVGIDDSEGNPKTREVIRILIEERGLPVASANCGYWLLESRDQLDKYVETLEGRISGIQERIDMVTENYQAAIADGGQIHLDPTDIRHEILNVVEEHGTMMRDDVTIEVSDRLDCTPLDVQEQLNEMKEAGLCYISDDGEVTTP